MNYFFLHFYNFVIDAYHIFKREDGVTLKVAWEMYKAYVDDAKIPYPLTQRAFKEELKNYFKNYEDRYNMDDGSRVRSYYSGFKTEMFDTNKKKETINNKEITIDFKEQESIFDVDCADCLAQYASTKETPSKKWDNVKTTLKSINTKRIHYVKIPENHIVIDFDIKDESGKKSYEKNIYLIKSLCTS